MSTIEASLETVFDAEPKPRLGLASAGMLMTADEFRAVDEVDESYRYELINGVVIVSPAPAEGERSPNGRLDQWLWNYHDSHPQGKSLDDTLFEQEVETSWGIRRADRVIWAGLGRRPRPEIDPPTIVIEFVSGRRRDQRRDYEQKRKEYAAIGVAEYWIIDRFRRTLTVCCGDAISRIVRENETYTTEQLPGFELPLGKLLAVADRWAE